MRTIDTIQRQAAPGDLVLLRTSRSNDIAGLVEELNDDHIKLAMRYMTTAGTFPSAGEFAELLRVPTASNTYAVDDFSHYRLFSAHRNPPRMPVTPRKNDLIGCHLASIEGYVAGYVVDLDRNTVTLQMQDPSADFRQEPLLASMNLSGTTQQRYSLSLFDRIRSLSS